jgi:hypothetical protein
LYAFIVFRLVSYHSDVEVAQKVTQLLREDGIVLLKHVGAIVKRKIKKYRIQCILLVIVYILLLMSTGVLEKGALLQNGKL